MMMAKSPKISKNKPTWSDLKRNLVDLDRSALLALVQDLYAAGKDNQIFLQARFGLGDDVLKPYKATIARWVCPEVMDNQYISVSKAKKAISDYKKALGRPDGLADLSVFYCEACVEFLGLYGMDNEDYFNALVRMFEQSLKAISKIEQAQQPFFVERLERVQREGHHWGYFVGDDMDSLMAEYGFAEE